ncbi:MAG: hypothetical protein AB1424_00365 [Thermodesulfobacteriota bacterium]
MISKVGVIKDTIQEAFPDSEIHYVEKKFKLHKFRIDRAGLPSCWLYFTYEYILNHIEKDIIYRLLNSKVFDIFHNTNKPKWFAIGNYGVKEVDDSYGRS